MTALAVAPAAPISAAPAALAAALSLPVSGVSAVMALLDEGATIPFIARYRKEATGSLDEVQVAAVRDALEKARELDKRRAAVLASLEERGLLTPQLAGAVAGASTLTALEDVYLPYRPKRVTRAEKARRRGLAPLAEALRTARPTADALALAAPHVTSHATPEGADPELAVPDVQAALAGARDILAENCAESAPLRGALRDLFVRRAVLRARAVPGKETEGATYADWFGHEERAAAMPSHRLLAMLRGEREGFLSVSVRPDDAEALDTLHRRAGIAAPGTAPRPETAAGQVEAALADAWKRLLAPSLENELRTALRERAEAQAIGVFAANLRELIMAPPLGGRRVLALDPGWRTGSKLVCLDAQGTLLHHEVIHPLTGDAGAERAARTLRDCCARYAMEVVAVGNGTAGRETEAFVRNAGLPAGVDVVLVNETGASVYSASDVARREFPDHDLTVRGAVSIGRRLMDPLAELVKIDPRSLGVGQYQHDVDQAALRRSLDEVVASCVNAVGVDANTASPELLAHVSGIGPVLARNIVAHRAENGPFRSRRDLLKVPRLGPKAFEQAAGFLRVRGDNPLDASAVHPERYALVARMAADLGCALADLLRRDDLRGRIRPEQYVADGVGLPTLGDILAELARPGRDPRPSFTPFRFAEGVHSPDDLEPGMVLPGIVTNVTAFGAFVDIGVHRDGLVHVSQLSDHFVRDPAEVVAPGRTVRVRVLEVDRARGRVSLAMKGVDQQ
ncbi:Tex family protein [Cupidesulfovibrio sp. SRB-5]|uniref:Tex family protein n=1 Tax=Nitratidesulfovibrio sp. SRB-5 TaxID=2872636 RepID=UPI0021DB2EDB